MNIFTVAEALNSTSVAWHQLACIKYNGFAGNISYGVLAQPSDDVIGITFAPMQPQQTAQIAVLGIITRVNTALWPAGTQLYCGTNGYLTNVPDGPVLAQVLKQHAWDGVLYVNCVTAGGAGGGTLNGTGTAGGLTYWQDSNTLASAPNINIDAAINGFNLNGAQMSGLIGPVILNDNQTDVPFITFPQAGNEDCKIQYSVVRDGERRVGEMIITSTPTKAGINDVFAETSPLGVFFDVELNAGNIIIKYSTTATGINASLRYRFDRWGGL